LLDWFPSRRKQSKDSFHTRKGKGMYGYSLICDKFVAEERFQPLEPCHDHGSLNIRASLISLVLPQLLLSLPVSASFVEYHLSAQFLIGF